MPAEAPLLLLRADAGPGIGSGHVTRLLALAEAWIDAGGRAQLLTAAPSPGLREQVATRGVDLTVISAAHPDKADLDAVSAAVHRCLPGTWIAVDGYGFDYEYLSALRERGARILRVDDGPRGKIPCDAFLDQNPGAEESAPNLPATASN